MAFKAGELCCSSTACVLLDVDTGSESEEWDLIPHVTQISVTQAVNSPKLVTSSTGGLETSACGSISSTGNLAIACHGGTGPGFLCANRVYRIRWSEDCSNIWNPDSGAVADNEAGYHFEALIRITNVPVDYNIAGNTALIFNYGFDVVEWITSPPCQSRELTE